MRRRDFIGILGGAFTWPIAARSQQAALPAIGFVNSASRQTYQRALSACIKGLAEAGYVEGHNVTIEYRWADGQYDKLPSLIADLAQRKVSVIAATSTPAAIAAKAAITTIPIVFTTSGDPIRPRPCPRPKPSCW